MFRHCIETRQQPFNNGHAGLTVVQMLEAVDHSLARDGALVDLARLEPRVEPIGEMPYALA
jgi:hypothetical protein